MTQGNPCCHGAREHPPEAHCPCHMKGCHSDLGGGGSWWMCGVKWKGRVSTGKVKRTKAAWECTQRDSGLELWPHHLPQELPYPKSSSIWQHRLRDDPYKINILIQSISRTSPFSAAVSAFKQKNNTLYTTGAVDLISPAAPFSGSTDVWNGSLLQSGLVMEMTISIFIKMRSDVSFFNYFPKGSSCWTEHCLLWQFHLPLQKLHQAGYTSTREKNEI